MARAKAVSWFNLVAGLVLGATAQPLLGEAVAIGGTNDVVVAQALGRATQVHADLNKAIECHRQGDYETADALFKDVLAHLADLTVTEQDEFKHFSQDNVTALAAQRNAHRYLGYAENSLAANDKPVAADLIKKASLFGQYMTAEDKQRLDDLSAQLRVVRSAPPPPAPTGPDLQPANPEQAPAAADDKAPSRITEPQRKGSIQGLTTAADMDAARAKVKQARSQLGQSNFEACEKLCAEAEAVKVDYAKGEDTPAKVREDLVKAKADSKALLAAARAALARKEYDRAEEYGHLAEKASSSWSFNILGGDTPAKVLHDVEVARAQAKAEAVKAQTPAPVPADKPAPGMLDSIKGVFGGNGPPDQSPSAKPVANTVAKPAANPDPTPAVPAFADSTEAARKLLKNGRAALMRNDLVTALRCGNEAQALKPDLRSGEDTPEQLLADVAHADAAAKTVKVDPKPAADAKTAKPDPHKQREQALALMKTGRDLLADNKIDDAMKSAVQAKALNVAWGYFDDTPDTLLRDIEKYRDRHNQEESVKVLAEGRRLLALKDYDGAMRAAYRAQTLHGTYYIWELGDRPENLIGDIEAVRVRSRKIETPSDKAVVKKDDKIPPPAPPPSDSKPTPPVTVAQGPRPADDIRQVGATDSKTTSPYAASGTPLPPFMPGDASTGPQLLPTDKPFDTVAHAKGEPVKGADANKEQALRLLDEARKQVKDGDLVGARQKCLEAERLHVNFAINEESPAELLQKVSAVVGTRVQGLVALANDLSGDSRKPEAQRWADAERKLIEARELTTLFGLDPQLVDGRLQWVRTNKSLAAGGAPQTPSAPADVAHDAPLTPAQQQGVTLLDKARNQLRAGNTIVARKTAEDACQEKYAVREQAYQVLREIDKEEFQQSLLAERRKFGAVVSAYNKQDYSQARAMLDTVNTKALTEPQLDKLKEMLQTVEMQPARQDTAIVQAQDKQPVGPGSSGTDLPPTAANPGVAHITDLDPQQSILKATEAMRTVQYDKLRKMGVTAQRDAADKFRAGQADTAIDTLKDYLAALDSEHLDTNQTAMLRRPVERRLDEFRMLKEQESFQNESARVAKGGFDEHGRTVLKEEAKQKRVADLLKQFNACYHDNKYSEAYAYAVKAQELDPDNGIAAASVTLAERQMRVLERQGTKKEQEEMGYQALNATDKLGPYVEDGIHIDKDRYQQSKKRLPLSGMQERKPADREIEAKLNLPVAAMHFSNTKLSQAIDDLHVMHGINFKIDVLALQSIGRSEDSLVSINLEQISLKSALKLMLKDLGLTYVTKDEAVQITTPINASGSLVRNTIQVADLVIPIENSILPESPFATGMGATGPAAPPAAPTAPAGGASVPGGGGSSVGSPSASPFASLSNGNGVLNGEWNKKKPNRTMEDALINLIQNSVEPNSWNGLGGPGTIQYFAPTMSLVINQTVDIQEQILDLLASLRALQDQEVAVEVRFITIADDFYERIGVDFNMDIQTNKATAAFQPALLQSQFSPQGFLNNPQFKGLISGLTPAGTLTNDLSIPINANSFNASFPQFGGYIPGTGGIDVGLAFLSDIQVFLFLEAVSGDVRTNVMTAPKLTLENGQISTIIVGEGIRNFFTSVNYTLMNNQIVAQPIITSIAQTGVTLTMQAVISADRRFVRMSPTITLTNTSNTTPTATIPIQLPLYPTLTDFGNGQVPVLFTEYLSAPSVNTVAVNTTVTVPDGGTVLMGGLKIMSEGRNEYGAPILSKIPYIDRLFRNTSFGRDNRSLMLMVTPRIIIQAEEEERQTGFVAPRQNNQ